MWTPEDFLDRYGDTIDDRVADVLDEILAERRDPGPRAARLVPTVAVLVAAVLATYVMRHDVVAVCAVWIAAAVIHRGALRIGVRRSTP